MTTEQEPGQILLSLTNVEKSYGAVRALQDVAFEARAGEIVALVGDNGAGKSTLIKAIAGVSPADSARITFEGAAVSVETPQDAAKLGIATVYQDLALCDNLDVVANLFLGREQLMVGPYRSARLLDKLDMARQTRALLAGLGARIPDVLARVEDLSGGQRQAVAIARAILGEPKVVLLDEPTAALGVAQTAQVLQLLRRLKARGLGVVVISHNLADVFAVADRICVLRLGRNAGEFSTAEATHEQVVSAITGLTPSAGTGTGRQLHDLTSGGDLA
ncbi:ATP-binding cassette domain-containing protein [Amycolatopsis rhabdoformis]|uniref:ATP-binding cassette domain-containing protein n=1 Tax=Amycolatopsis rhabdoformis TaxID=1448059 RepID=A0ABZ1II49_9PSEU|nr:ATP-binding cassette domain-containing protein [Amycolatopsis rhabdoformis]WSE34062.1 ATP-binding cassette domain-containing protein [Amycolatopsis rhabdoformis]